MTFMKRPIVPILDYISLHLFQLCVHEFILARLIWKIKKLIITFFYNKKRTEMHYAAIEGDVVMIERLHKEGLNVNQQDKVIIIFYIFQITYLNSISLHLYSYILIKYFLLLFSFFGVSLSHVYSPLSLLKWSNNLWYRMEGPPCTLLLIKVMLPALRLCSKWEGTYMLKIK